jgi:hypothetical protein
LKPIIAASVAGQRDHAEPVSTRIITLRPNTVATSA